ncbi:MAG: transporter substrate-binding domain-containing protein [Actinophytocola sp.]|uniref:glutamate ABC transporter substrate-binding protein n=1 Tax=Actinophytocola sp. TaxID=1872138 RepID=UPI00132B9151|nr:glutamate ABC transporter substrate-binding protein [Actinophytocola sp.]MPZ83242.1 transporter substrate-binding domain-containing protein [Actinophytocola sp.]
MNRRKLTAVLVGALLLVAGCGADEAVPPTEVTAKVPLPAGATELTEPPEAPAAEDCGDPTASLRPGSLPAPNALPPGSTMAKIRAKGKLVVGVDQNTYRFGYRDPFTGSVEGFDIDMAKAIARAIFGNDKALQLRILTSAQRIPALKAGDVDIVIRTMSINCDRLKDVDFSSVYYEAGQRVLVKEASGYTGIDSLGGKRVCATDGSTSLRNIAAADSKPVPVKVSDWTDCLVMLQQNQVDAVSTDDTILAGLRAQDPFTQMVGDPFYNEPYGMAMPKGQPEFVRFVNAVIERMRTDGSWQATYDKWLSGLLDPASPPAAKYKD